MVHSQKRELENVVATITHYTDNLEGGWALTDTCFCMQANIHLVWCFHFEAEYHNTTHNILSSVTIL